MNFHAREVNPKKSIALFSKTKLHEYKIITIFLNSEIFNVFQIINKPHSNNNSFTQHTAVSQCYAFFSFSAVWKNKRTSFNNVEAHTEVKSIKAALILRKLFFYFYFSLRSVFFLSLSSFQLCFSLIRTPTLSFL